MRKLLSLLIICLAVSANARQITSDEAATIASEFLNSSISVKKAGAQVNVRRIHAKDASRGSEENQPFYVFNASDNNGFVIISGDDRAKKILGYSDTGNFDVDNMPPQLSAMFVQYAKQISNLTGDSPDPSWTASSRAASDTQDGILLETVNWGQWDPYNAQCPFDLLQCPTGCCATAMAIIMQYHQWPKKARGYHFSVETKELTNLTDYTIDWNLLNKPIDDIRNDENAVNQISSLFRNIGETINTEYHFEGSGSYGAFMYPALFNCFKYCHPRFFFRADESAQLWDGIPEDEWVSLINDELFNGRPIIYMSRLDDDNPASAHAYVVDGIDASGLYHVNWGWDGYDNGYFALWIKGSEPSVYHSMITNIQPDYEATDDLTLAYIAPSELEDVGWNVDYQKKYNNSPIEAADFDEQEGSYMGVLSGLVNPFDSEYEYAIAFVDKDFNILSLACKESDIQKRDLAVEAHGFYRTNKSFWSIKSTSPDNAVGTSPVYRLSEFDQWKIIPAYSGSMNFSALDGSTSKYTSVEWDIPSYISYRIWNSIDKKPSLPGKILSNSYPKVIEVNLDFGNGNFYYNGHEVKTESSSQEWPVVVIPHGYYREMRAEPIKIEFRHNSNCEKKIMVDRIWYIINDETREARPTYNSYNYTYEDYNDNENYSMSIFKDNFYIPSCIVYEDKSYVVTEVGHHAFRRSTLANILTIPSSIKSIGYGAFDACSINELRFEKGSQLRIIEDWAFASYTGSYLELPEGLDEIGEANFTCLQNTIKLPKSLKKIGSRSLHPNPYLEDGDITMIVQWDNPTEISVSNDIFDISENYPEKNFNKKLIVPIGTKELYESLEPWSSFEISEYQEPTITISETNVVLKKGESLQLSGTMSPAYSDIKWESSNENVAVVTSEGLIIALEMGEATITASATFDSNINAECHLTVPVLAESLTVDPTIWNGEEGASFQISAVILPENTTTKTLEWSSSDSSIATVDNTGMVSVLKEGLCTISVSTTDGSNLIAECKLNVSSGIEEIFADDVATVSVYNTQGSLIKKNCTKQELYQLPAGKYIICSTSEAIKVLIK